MTQSEYIVWKCETILDIEEQHPDWNKEQVMQYFNAVEDILKRTTDFEKPKEGK